MIPLPFQSLDIVLLLFQERCLLLLSHFSCVFGIYKELVVLIYRSTGNSATCWTYLDRLNTEAEGATALAPCCSIVYMYRMGARSLSLSLSSARSPSFSQCVATLVVAPKFGQVMAHVIYEAYAHKKAHTIMDRHIAKV